MIRLRARLPAFLALGLLASVAGAATIDVTTPYDITADNDELCSVREAVHSSQLAVWLSRRSGGKTAAEASKTALETALLQINEDPINNSYPRGELLSRIQAMLNEVEDYDPIDAALDPTLLADIETFQDVINALTTNANASQVEQAIALDARVLASSSAAVTRLEGLAEVDGCIDGTAFDVVAMEADTTYFLCDQVDVAVRVTFRGGENTKITGGTSTTECGGLAVPTTAHRYFHFGESAVIEMYTLEITGGGKRGSSVIATGGALAVDGPLTVDNVTFTGNTAVSGGAIFGGPDAALTINSSVFVSNEAHENGGAIAFTGNTLRIADTVFGRDTALLNEGNRADTLADAVDGAGGAVYFNASGNGSAVLERLSVVGNSAAIGSAIYVNGLDTSAAIDSSTVARNAASLQAAIHVAATGGGAFTLNNVTLVENTAAAGGAGLRVTDLAGVRVTNSIVAGNTGTAGAANDCDFGVLVLDPDDFRRNYYVTGSACLGEAWPSPTGVPENYNFFTVAAGDVVGYLLDDSIDPAYYVPVYPILGELVPRVVNNGAGPQDLFRCSDQDQRANDRLSSVDSDCDIGAIEFQIGRRIDDVIDTFVNQRTCLDVTSNDVGDADYIQGTLVVYGADRAGTTLLIASTDPAAYMARRLADTGVAVDPATVVPMSSYPECADIQDEEAILFTPPSGFRGEVIVTYGLQWEADADGNPATAGGDVSGRARVMMDSRAGITSDSLGAMGGFWLLALGLAALRRLPVRRGFAFATLVFAASFAQAADNIIYVNAGLDEPNVTTPGDGLCTLREALNTARNDQANLTGGDCLDGIEGPDIIEFTETFVDTVGGVTTVTLQDTLIAYGGITLRCPRAEEGETQQICRIQRVETVPPALPTKRFRLIDSRGSLVLGRMHLEGGYTVDDDPLTPDVGREGGAIYSTGGLVLEECVLRNNVASAGGAVFIGGARSALAIIGSVFEGNRSTNDRATGAKGGGVVASTQSDDHKITIESSTFSGNSSVGGAAVLNLNSTGSAIIANSTFSGNSSTQGAGVIDASGVLGNITLRNLTIVDNVSGEDPAAEPWDVGPPYYRAAIEAGTRVALLTTNIIAANFDSTGLLDANCGSGILSSFYNLYGGADCPAGPGDLAQAPTAVYDATSPTTSGLLGPLADIGVLTPMHVPRSPVATTGVIVDAGYKDTGTAIDNQVAPLQFTEKCANIDQRGVSRASGGRCDRGAWEYLSLTALNDNSSNFGRTDRLVIADILKNDLYDDIDNLTTNDFKTDCVPPADTTSVPGHAILRDGSGDICVDVTVAPATGTVDFLRKNVLAELRVILSLEPGAEITVSKLPDGYLDGTFPDDFVPGWDWDVSTQADADALAAEFIVTEAMLKPGYVLVYDNNGVLATEDFGEPVTLSYVAYAFDQAIFSSTTEPAEVELVVDNPPPVARNDSVTVGVGQTARLRLLDNDEDLDQGPDTLVIKKLSCDPVTDADDPGLVVYWQCDFGKAWVDSATGELTYRPDNIYNPFLETFTYEVSDDDPDVPKRATATVTIRVGRTDSSAGALLAEDDLSDLLGIDFLGAPGHLFMLSLLLSLARRRRR